MSNRKTGSALLVVLGMVSFMIVSAVSFAIYMRQSRAPSSYVRRNVATRQIVKAALARAIDEIDTAIGNDPFPGVGKNAKQAINGGLVDRWPHRVFTPSNEVSSASTVSTLALEGLGYLPPPLINDVRYMSRHTITAQWKSFNYDLGRYAFTAVNVSDYFDINKVMANDPRTSQAPISLSALFMNDNYSDFALTPSAWDTKIETAVGTTEPLNRFFSLMDYNLLLRGDTWGVLKSPFWNIINNGTAGGSVYGSMTTNDLCRQVFVTDSYFQSSDRDDTRIDLAYREHQPFDGLSGFPEKSKLDAQMDYGNGKPFWNVIGEKIPVVGQMLLGDYLDYDSVPSSLCIPSAELAPMIMGVEMSGDVKFKPVLGTVDQNSITPAYDDTANSAWSSDPGSAVQFKRKYDLELSASPEFTVSVVFPFRRASSRNVKTSYKVEVYARLFFTASSGDVYAKGLRASGDGASYLNILANNLTTWPTTKASQPTDGCVDLYGTANVSIDPDVETQDDVINKIKEVAISPSPLQQTFTLVDALHTEAGATAKTVPDGTGTKTVYVLDTTTGTIDDPGSSYSWRFLAANWAKQAFSSPNAVSTGEASQFRPSIAVWVRIANSSGSETYDCVPAAPGADGLNGFNSVSIEGLGNAAGTAPLFRFFPKVAGDQNFLTPEKAWWEKNNGTEFTTVWAQRTYVAQDPRYNWAPEDWVGYETAEKPATKWKDTLLPKYLGTSGRDTDVFMATSDRGYMQSVYEWMFVPQTKPLGSGDAEWGNLSGKYDGAVRTETDTPAHADLMWRTYRCDAFGADWGSLDELSFVPPSVAFRTNPFGDGSTVKAAFVNTPYDWWAAASNHLSGVSVHPPNDKTFSDAKDALKYTFGPKSEDDASAWEKEDINTLIGGFTSQMSGYMNQHPESTWTNAFDALKWNPYNGTAYNGTEKNVTLTTLFDANADPLYEMHEDITSVDRKYLYGFWRNCFQNEQQLFLVFVRAEPNAQGGSANAAGGRAVALVWRDPNPPSNYASQDNASIYLQHSSSDPTEAWRLKNRPAPPHRTRVLFYRAFD